MGWVVWRIQAAFWTLLARRIPTCFLQCALDGRAGVSVYHVPYGQQSRSFEVSGPCVVTINRD